jgi:uncharacterized protein (TIGR03435 family)
MKWLFARVLLGLAVAAAHAVAAQAPNGAAPAPTAASPASASLPEFDAATIKPRDPKAKTAMGVDLRPGGHLRINAVSLKSLVCTAYNLSYWQVSGGPDWAGKTEYDVEAKPPEPAHITDLRHTWSTIHDEQLRLMLQALLIDRFQLAVHRDTKTGKILILKQKGKALRLKDPHPIAADGSPLQTVGFVGGRWSMNDTSMAQLAHFAADFILHQPVVDQTGLSGAYDFRSAMVDDDASSLGDDTFSSFLGEMGLTLHPAKGPVESLVILKAEPPSAN